ncbi:MAG: tyrosine-protein phosphatase [Coprobacillus sp.]
MENIIRLPLENAYNVRELGGYYSNTYQSTKWHRFLRADDISCLSESDIDFLLVYGVNSVVDLRSDEECQQHPDALINVEGIKYYHYSFMKGNIADATRDLTSMQDFDLGDFYVELVKDKDMVRGLLTVIADADDGCLLFHCSAGKDRTGVLSMLLLMIAGVSIADIEANYQLTYTYLKEKPGFMDMIPTDMDLSCMYSKPEMIRKAIDYIVSEYEDIQTYLTACGISHEVLLRLKSKLL